MSVSLPFGQSASSASILVVDDEPDVADLFRQRFRHGTYVMHFATSAAEALDRLAGKRLPLRPRATATHADESDEHRPSQQTSGSLSAIGPFTEFLASRARSQ
jgi:CheY-like chemotaxis protein